ncbi:hypothetical protein Q3G72_009040 [Acer saccharum]|nr:hypothetical protein Q3G72_034107 [Acer saccharum]KAK1570921.1 hypothetical protein Q3G72_009040 [Acer saccharum]
MFSLGPVGIGGELRNSTSLMMCQFSISVGIQESNSAEVLAILKACELCSSNARLVGSNIQVVSNSLEVVSWVNNSDNFGNLSNLKAINDIRGNLRSLKGLSIIFNSRALNVDADRLAKRSSSGGEDILEWFGF